MNLRDRLPQHQQRRPDGDRLPTVGRRDGLGLSGERPRLRLRRHGQNAASAPIGQNYRATNDIGLATLGSSIYMSRQGVGDVVQLKANGTLNQVIVSGIPAGVGLVSDSFTGHLFANSNGNSQVFDIDPIAKTKTVFFSFSGGSDIDGLSLAPNGKTLYAAVRATGHIIGIDTTTKVQGFDSGAVPGGIEGPRRGPAISPETSSRTPSAGPSSRSTLATKAQTLIASGGSRGDCCPSTPTARSC